MNLATIVTAIARVWQSRWTSVVFVLVFAGTVGRGLLVGAREANDIDAQVRVQLNYQHTTRRDVFITGRATLFTVRHDGLRALLLGPCGLHVHCDDVAHAMLNLEVGWENARSGDSFRLVDTATGATHVVDNLVVHHSGIMVPLPRLDTVLRIEPSHPSLGLRVHGLKLLTDVPMTPFAVDTQWEVVHQDEAGSVALGAGFWPRPAGSMHLETQRCAYLRVDATRPGPHLLRLAFTRPDPATSMPIVTLGEQRVWSAAEGATVWSRATTVDGATTLELSVDLGPTNVVGLECVGPFASAWERGLSSDLRRLAYDIALDRCEVRPAK